MRKRDAAAASSPSKRSKQDAAPETLVYWLGDSTISLLMCDNGRRGKKEKAAGDQCAAAWQALNEELPSRNLGERGQMLTDSVGSTKPLLKHVDNLVQFAASSSTTPKPRAFVVSAGYNNLKDADFVLETITAQLDRLHEAYPEVPVLVLGLAVSHNGTDEVIEAAQQVTEGLAALVWRDAATRRRDWLTVLHPDEWITREAEFPFYAIDNEECPAPHWEDEEKVGGGSLHLSKGSRVRQLGVIKGALRRLLKPQSR